MSLKSKISRALLIALLGAALMSAPAAAHLPLPPKAPSEIGRRAVNLAVADFTLTDQNGKPFRFASARGKLVLVTFIFTACPDVCPLLTADFQSWSFLTGSRAELAKVWKEFGVHVVKNESGQVQHTTFTTVIDRRGRR